jgi:hypothetical protein
MGLKRGPLSLVSIPEEPLEWKSSESGSRKRRLTAVGIRCADQATSLPAKVGTNFVDMGQWPKPRNLVFLVYFSLYAKYNFSLRHYAHTELQSTLRRNTSIIKEGEMWTFYSAQSFLFLFSFIFALCTSIYGNVPMIKRPLTPRTRSLKLQHVIGIQAIRCRCRQLVSMLVLCCMCTKNLKNFGNLFWSK